MKDVLEMASWIKEIFANEEVNLEKLFEIKIVKGSDIVETELEYYDDYNVKRRKIFALQLA